MISAVMGVGVCWIDGEGVWWVDGAPRELDIPAHIWQE